MPTKAKLQMRDTRTGLLIGSDSQLVISSVKDANKAVEAAGKLVEEIAEIRANSKLGVLEAEYENLRSSLRDWQKENDVDEISHAGFISTLIQRRKSFWVWSADDIPENIALEDDIIPLRDVVKRRIRDLKKRNKVISKITQRVVVPAALDELVREGVLKPDDVKDSYAVYIETYYVQIKENRK